MGDILTAVGIALALFFGVVGTLQGRKANAAAADALAAAQDASQTGEEAVGIAKRAEARSTESSNIHWEGQWTDVGVYCLINKGDDDAHDVKSVVTIDDEEIRGTAVTVPGKGGQLELRFPKTGGECLKERAEYRRWKRQSGQTGPMGLPMGSMLPPQFFHAIRERLDWVTGNGTPGFHDESRNMASIDPEY